MILKTIPNPIPSAYTTMNLSITMLKEFLEENKINMNPDYQRGYVWSYDQKVKFLEFFLRGGASASNLYFNIPNWASGYGTGDLMAEVVDGKQRITAILEFIDGKIKVFKTKDHDGYTFNDFDEILLRSIKSLMACRLILNINTYKNKEDIINWYLGLNTGGSIHTDEDLKPAYEALENLKK